jgi:hypothetical protein
MNQFQRELVQTNLWIGYFPRVGMTKQAPFGGATLFMMAGVIAMPVRLSTHKLIHNLDTLQTTLGVDIAISNLPVSTNHKFQLPSPPQATV